MRVPLQAAQKKAHLSVRQLARELDVSFSALAKILRGETPTPSVHTDLAIRRFLGLDGAVGVECPCRRCTGTQGGGESLTQLTEWLEDIRQRLDAVEEAQQRLTHLVKAGRRKVY